jgi:hypothetical protein
MLVAGESKCVETRSSRAHRDRKTVEDAGTAFRDAGTGVQDGARKRPVVVRDAVAGTGE